MSLSSSTSSISYAGNNSTVTAYVVPFYFIDATDLTVYVTDVAGVTITLSSGTYTVTGAGSQSGGTITTAAAVPTTSSVVIARNVPATQLTSYTTGDRLPAATIEKSLDKLTMLAQQGQRSINTRSDAAAVSIKEYIDNEVSNLSIYGSSNPMTRWAYTGDGTTKAFAVTGSNVSQSSSYLVALDGVTQDPANYTIFNSTLTFSEAPPNGTGIVIVGLGYQRALSGANEYPVTATGSTTPRTLANRFADVVNVKDFGAVGNGVADDTASIQSAINSSISQNGKTVFFPEGTYIVSSKINITDACELLGENLSSIIQTSSSFVNGDVIYVTGPLFQVGRAITINNIFFNASVVRSSGYFINFYGNNTSRINNCQFWSGYKAVGYTGAASAYHKIYNCIFHDNIETGIDIIGSSGSQGDVDVVISDCFIAGATATNNTYAGIHIASAGDISLRHVSTVWCNNGLTIDPVFGKRTQAVLVTDCFFDSGNGWGIYCYTKLGSIQLLSITQTWVATNGQGGIYLGGTGSVMQANLANVYSSNNTGDGLYISTNCQNITVDGGSFAANSSHGIHVAANVSNFIICGVVCGATGEFSGNGNYGICIDAGSSNNYIIKDNQLAGNGTGGLFDGGTGTNKITYPNLGAGTSITTLADPSNQWGVNFSQKGYYPITASGTYQLAVGSGMVMLHNNNDGSLGLFLAYAGTVVKVAGSATMVSGAAGSNQIGLTYNSVAGKYQISNGFSTTQNIYIAGIQTRPAS